MKPYTLKSYFAFLLLTVLFSCNSQPPDSYELTLQETLELAQSEDYKVSPGEGKKLLAEGKAVFVDIRSESEYAKGHLEGGVNIPLQHLLDKESREFFSEEPNLIILYGHDEAEANGPWLLLRQLGYENTKLLEGGYAYQQAPDSVQYLPPEAAHYDFRAVMARAYEEDKKEEEANRPKAQPAPVAKAPAKTIVPKRKEKPKVVEEEGC